jgi:hypothetical protein
VIFNPYPCASLEQAPIDHLASSHPHPTLSHQGRGGVRFSTSQCPPGADALALPGEPRRAALRPSRTSGRCFNSLLPPLVGGS